MSRSVDFLFPSERIPSQILNGRHPGVCRFSLAQQSPFPTAAWMSLPASLGPVFRLGGMAQPGERQMVGPGSSLFPCRGVPQEASGVLGGQRPSGLLSMVGVRPLNHVHGA